LPEETRLFLIGDDKQSIYRFQGADVSTFNHWKARIATRESGLSGAGAALVLDQSFRSHPSVVAFINCFFAELFQLDAHLRPEFGHRASHQPLRPSRQEDHEAERVELIAFSAGEQETRDAGQIRLLEGLSVALWIKEKIAQGAPVFDKLSGQSRSIEYGDFAILVSQNADLLISNWPWHRQGFLR